MDGATREMLERSLRETLLEKNDSPLRDRLATLGWDAVLAEDSPTALRLLFETKGDALSSADALGPLLAQTIATSSGRPGLASAVVLIPSSLTPDRPSATASGGRIRIDGVACSPPSAESTLVLPVGKDDSNRLAVIGPGTDWISVPLEGLDPSLGLTHISGVCDEGRAEWIDDSESDVAWSAATVSARWALAAELAAIGRRVVADAVDYTGGREQFGRPIGTFQALQHRLAGAFASAVGAQDVTVQASESALAWDALVAKAVAGRAAENCCTQAQQAYGAIGFTWEHGFHRYLRRTYVLDRLFGDWRALEWKIGSSLLESGVVPKVGSL